MFCSRIRIFILSTIGTRSATCLDLRSNYGRGSLETEHPCSSTEAYDCLIPGPCPDRKEATIDAEWASAAAPNAAIEVASCSDSTTNFGGFIALENLFNRIQSFLRLSSGLSYSAVGSFVWGSAFKYLMSSHVITNKAAIGGRLHFASAFRRGRGEVSIRTKKTNSHARSIGVSGFASTPYNVAVCGTDFGHTFAQKHKHLPGTRTHRARTAGNLLHTGNSLTTPARAP